MQDSNGIIVLNSHVNGADNIDSSRQDINLDSDFNFVSSTTSVTSIVSEESSTDNLPTEYESEDSSSVNHKFVNDSEVYSIFFRKLILKLTLLLLLIF